MWFKKIRTWWLEHARISLLTLFLMAFAYDSYLIYHINAINSRYASLHYGPRSSSERQNYVDTEQVKLHDELIHWALWALPLWLIIALSFSLLYGYLIGAGNNGNFPWIVGLMLALPRAGIDSLVLNNFSGGWGGYRFLLLWPCFCVFFIFTVAVSAHRLRFHHWPVWRGARQNHELKSNFLVLPGNKAFTDPNAQMPLRVSRPISPVTITTVLTNIATFLSILIPALIAIVKFFRQ
jgi:hypothetical protein